jgi:hypothetical protein
MRKYCFALLLAATGAAQAQVTTSAWFTPPPVFQENFDSILPGSYTNVGVFGFPAVAYRTTAGGWLDVGPPIFPNPPAFSPLNTIIGVNSGVGYKVSLPMRRFGGYFRSNVNSAGVANTSARLLFFDQAGNLIGAVTINLGPVWTQFAWQTVPKWRRVEVYGAPFGIGGVEMDSVWVRPN